VDVAGDRRGADEADSGDVGMLEERVDGGRVTPAGNPASVNNWARRTETEGSFSDGLSTKQFPQATATG